MVRKRQGFKEYQTERPSFGKQTEYRMNSREKDISGLQLGYLVMERRVSL